MSLVSIISISMGLQVGVAMYEKDSLEVHTDVPMEF